MIGKEYRILMLCIIKGEMITMNKKLFSVIAAAVLSIQAAAMPIIANAEASATYITNSDFKDCAVGGNTENPIYGLNIILDGSPWLSKGSASKHYETFYYDEERGVNYCNMYSNSDKSGTNDGAGSMYMYQRDTTQNFAQTYGYCQFDVRMHEGLFQLMLGSFSDPTSNTNYLANTLEFTATGITAFDGSRQVQIASISPEKWYTVKIAVDNVLQSVSISVTDVESGKVIGQLDDAVYQSLDCNKVCIWCFGYKRGNTYNYDLTNVTIDKSTETKNPYSV